MVDDTEHGMATRAIHGNTARDSHGSPHTPIYNTTTFAFVFHTHTSCGVIAKGPERYG